MDDAPVRFGILGAGLVARGFADGLRAVPGGSLSSVWSRTTTTAAGFVELFPGTRVATSAEELVSDPRVDVVYVATPHHRHAEDSLLALRNGKAVLCEKPFATSSAEAREVVDEARNRNVFCMEGMWMRFIPIVRNARRLVEEGAIGEPRMLAADFGFAMPYDAASRFFDPDQGGGALLDRGVYGVSLAHMMFGTPDEVTGLIGAAATGVDEHIGAVLTFTDGRLAVITASLTSTTPTEAWIAGTRGRIDIAAPFYCPERLTLTRYEAVAAAPSTAPTGVRDQVLARAKRSSTGRRAIRLIKPIVRRAMVVRRPVRANGYEYEAEEVVRCVRAGLGESPGMPLDESIAIMETLERLRGTGA
jgi:predicted dehydrogenase